MVPAPRGTGIVAARVPKKVLQFAGIDDVFTSSRGSTKTLGNFVKVMGGEEAKDPYGACITGGVGAGMLLEVWINKKVREDGGVIWEFDK